MTIKRKLSIKLASVLCILPIFLLMQCTSSDNISDKTKFDDNDVLGYGFLKRIPGLWNGPVSTDTPAGNFPIVPHPNLMWGRLLSIYQLIKN